ncbi:MAG TPA: ABC transporter substrate-binding protein, partial [Dehalococcoidia bacterium]|nr:ABC transporter substrate-binding protein [Dehalococcoidia bacterium]
MSDDNYWTRTRRTNRRRFLTAGAGAASAGAIALAIGCDDDDDDEGSGGSTPGGESSRQLPEGFEQARYGGVFRYAIGDPPVTLDIHAHDSPGGHAAVYPNYNALIREPEDPPGTSLGLQPELAEEWEQPDDTTLVLHVRKGVRFQNVEPTNGRELTTEDVKYTLERALGQHPHSSQVASEFRMRDMLGDVQSIEVTGDDTVTMTLREPYAPLLSNIAFGWLQVIPRDLVEGKGDRNVVRWAVGTGPYIMEGYDTLGDGGTITHVRNPDYWRKGHPFFDKIEQPIITAEETRQALYLNRELDNTFSITANVRDTLAEQMGENIQLFDYPPVFNYKVYFDLSNPDSPWARDERLRHAMYYLLPYDVILQSLSVDCCRGAPMAFALDPWALPEDEVPAAGLPLAEAIGEGVKMLAAAGFPPGTEIPLELSVSQFYGGTFLGEALSGIFGAIKQQSNGAVNLAVKLKVLELADWFKTVYYGGGRYEGTSHGDWGWAEPDSGLYRYFHPKGVANNTHTDDARLNQLLEAQR